LEGVGAQPRAEVVDLVLGSILNADRTSLEAPAERMRPDLEGGHGGSPGLARAELAGGNLRASLVQTGLDFIGQLQAVLVKIVKPRLQIVELLTAQFRNGPLDLLHRARGPTLPCRPMVGSNN